MVMAMLWRIPNNRRSMMRFMLIDRYENRVGVTVRAPAGMGACSNGKRHTDAQNPKRQLAHGRTISHLQHTPMGARGRL